MGCHVSKQKYQGKRKASYDTDYTQSNESNCNNEKKQQQEQIEQINEQSVQEQLDNLGIKRANSIIQQAEQKFEELKNNKNQLQDYFKQFSGEEFEEVEQEYIINVSF